jgi:tripartite-type tricarboxylate transporter receptor subunit TctC
VFPDGVPEDITKKMSDAIGAVLEDEEFLSKMEDQQLAPNYMDSEELDTYWQDLEEQYADLIPLAQEDS